MPDTATTIDALVDFTMPSLGADMDAGTILEWHVAPGAVVHKGDVVALVQTDKSDLDVEVFVDGAVVDLVVEPGVKVPVGTVLAHIAPLGAPAATSRPRTTRAPRTPAVPAPAPPPRPTAATPPCAAPPPLRSPILRHLAEQRHVDVAALHGTGPGGTITRDDIEHAPGRRRVTPRARRLARELGVDLAAIDRPVVSGDDVLAATSAPSPPSPSPSSPVPARTSHAAASPPDDAMRSAIARLMTRSWQQIPHFHVATRVDLARCLAALAEVNAARTADARILPAAVLAQAVARAAAAVPGVNGSWVDDHFVAAPAVHLGIVVSLRRGGLLAPVIHDAAVKPLAMVMAELRDLVTRARAGRLRASELGGATITLTELGEGEVESVTPIIHPPQVAIVGLGAIHDEPWACDGMLGVRPVVHAALSADHRAVDGRIASQYLSALVRLLQEAPTP